MIIRKAVFISILFASITCSGCAFTGKWHDMIESKITGCPPYPLPSSPCKVRLSTKTFSREPDSFGINDNGEYPEYKKCDYLGKEAIKGVNYHHYLCPNMYKDSKSAFLELFIPDAKSDGDGKNRAIIKSRWVIWAKRKNIHDPVYIHFATSPPSHYSYDTINPNFIRDFGDTPLPTDFPSLLFMDYDLGFGSIELYAGQRVETREAIDMLNSRDAPRSQKRPEIYRHYQEVCPGAGYCEYWYTLNTSGTIGTPIEISDTPTLWKITRDIGYIITFPLDIITSPIQLILIIRAAPGL